MRRVKLTPELSKAVGWDPCPIQWPSLEDLEEASDYQILKWYRFLESAFSPEERQVQEALYEIFTK